MASNFPYLLLTIVILLIQAICFSRYQRIMKNEIAGALCNTSLHEKHHKYPTNPNQEQMSAVSMSQVDVAFPDNSTNVTVRVRLGLWKPWPLDRRLPCYPAEERWWNTKTQRTPTKQGLLFVKEMKTGSSTIGGVVLRLARQLPKRYGLAFQQCLARVDHSPAGPRVMHYGDRIRAESFLFTFLREPSARYMSQYFHFQTSREKKQPRDANIQSYFVSIEYMHDYYMKDLSLTNYAPRQLPIAERPAYKAHMVTNILKDYDFIGITERMDESLVVLQLLLNLKTSDLLYLSAKSKGSFDDGAFNGTCVYIVPSYTSPSMKKWFSKSSTWNDRTSGDQLLYQAAIRSLDLTIDSLGRHLVQDKLKTFKKAQALAYKKCGSNLRLPCSPDGVRAKVFDVNQYDTDCLWLDSGCGYKCLDAISDDVDKM